MCSKFDWASFIVGSKFTVFALFFFVYEGNFSSTGPRGAYIWRGDLMEGFLRYWSWGLIFGGAYIWRGLFLEFYGRPVQPKAFWLAWFSGQITYTWATCPKLLNL